MVLELGNQSVSNLASLVTSLVLNLPVDDRHVLEVGNIVVLNHKHGATDLDDVVDLQGVQSTDLTFST